LYVMPQAYKKIAYRQNFAADFSGSVFGIVQKPERVGTVIPQYTGVYLSAVFIGEVSQPALQDNGIRAVRGKDSRASVKGNEVSVAVKDGQVLVVGHKDSIGEKRIATKCFSLAIFDSNSYVLCSLL